MRRGRRCKRGRLCWHKFVSFCLSVRFSFGFGLISKLYLEICHELSVGLGLELGLRLKFELYFEI